jgi:hypothetical protein
VQEVSFIFSYVKLTKIDKLLSSKERESQVYQDELITKYVDQCITPNDVVLYVGRKARIQTSQQVFVSELNNCSNAELVCRYADLTYFLEGSVTKIFIEADFIFSNGSILTKEGALNVALLGKYYNIPVLAVGGSWLYNGWGPVGQ